MPVGRLPNCGETAEHCQVSGGAQQAVQDHLHSPQRLSLLGIFSGEVSPSSPTPSRCWSFCIVLISEHEERRGGSLHQVERDDAEQRGGGHQVNNQLVQSPSLTQILLSSDIESGMFSDCRLSKIIMKF